jgi:subtilisin
MACPHVSGAAGHLIAAGYGPEEARARLGDTAEDVGLSSDEQGNGLLDVEAAVSGSADATPTVSWATPAAGETVSGTVAVRIGAADAEDADDALTVTYSADGGGERAATYDAETGYYEASWDSTLLSDGDHTLTARATDAAGNTGSATVSVVTDNVAGDAGAPTVDAIGIAEDNSGGNPHADFVVSWTVSDGAGDLSGLELTLTDRTTGEREAATSVDVSGGAASGTTGLKAKHEENSGHEYAVEAVVTDERGATATATATEVEDGR